MELEVLHQGAVVETRAVGESAVHVGRAAVNEVVLKDPGVSAHHAVFWPEGGVLLVRDLGSSNGTFVNDVRLKDSQALGHGDQVRLGERATIRVSGRVVSGPTLGPLRLEVQGTDLSWGVNTDRFVIPGDHDAALLIYPDGEIWLAVDGAEQTALELDEPFQIGDRAYVLRRDLEPTPDTLRPTITAYDYRLEVSLGAQRALLEDRATGNTVTVTTENRVALLYALADRWLGDGSGTGRGWLDDTEAAVAVWGRGHLQHGSNNYNVLVHRVRAELAAAGLDRWCVEKRQGRTRIRIAAAEIA